MECIPYRKHTYRKTYKNAGTASLCSNPVLTEKCGESCLVPKTPCSLTHKMLRTVLHSNLRYSHGVKQNGFMVYKPVRRSIQRNPIHPQLLVPKGFNHFFGNSEGNVLWPVCRCLDCVLLPLWLPLDRWSIHKYQDPFPLQPHAEQIPSMHGQPHRKVSKHSVATILLLMMIKDHTGPVLCLQVWKDAQEIG